MSAPVRTLVQTPVSAPVQMVFMPVSVQPLVSV